MYSGGTVPYIIPEAEMFPTTVNASFGESVLIPTLFNGLIYNTVEPPVSNEAIAPVVNVLVIDNAVVSPILTTLNALVDTTSVVVCEIPPCAVKFPTITALPDIVSVFATKSTSPPPVNHLDEFDCTIFKIFDQLPELVVNVVNELSQLPEKDVKLLNATSYFS